MEALIENFINGNLNDARKQAKAFSTPCIRTGFINHACYSFEKAQKVAEYLKGRVSFQDACDAQ